MPDEPQPPVLDYRSPPAAHAPSKPSRPNEIIATLLLVALVLVVPAFFCLLWWALLWIVGDKRF